MKISKEVGGLILFIAFATLLTVIPMIVAIRSNHP